MNHCTIHWEITTPNAVDYSSQATHVSGLMITCTEQNARRANTLRSRCTPPTVTECVLTLARGDVCANFTRTANTRTETYTHTHTLALLSHVVTGNHTRGHPITNTHTHTLTHGTVTSTERYNVRLGAVFRARPGDRRRRPAAAVDAADGCMYTNERWSSASFVWRR